MSSSVSLRPDVNTRMANVTWNYNVNLFPNVQCCVNVQFLETSKNDCLHRLCFCRVFLSWTGRNASFLFRLGVLCTVYRASSVPLSCIVDRSWGTVHVLVLNLRLIMCILCRGQLVLLYKCFHWSCIVYCEQHVGEHNLSVHRVLRIMHCTWNITVTVSTGLLTVPCIVYLISWYVCQWVYNVLCLLWIGCH